MHRALKCPLALVVAIAGAVVPPPTPAAAQQPRASEAAAHSAGCFTRDVSPSPADSAAARAPGAAGSGGERQQRGPAIVLFAAASAREVRFAAQPRIAVRLCGALMDSVRIIERRNLPDPVQPGVTYRDVYIAVEILGHLRAECLADRMTGQGPADACAALERRDSTTPPRRSPP